MPKFCVECGAALGANFKFCGECGAAVPNSTNINAATINNSPLPPPPPPISTSQSIPKFTKSSSEVSQSPPSNTRVPEISRPTVVNPPAKPAASQGQSGRGGGRAAEAKREEEFFRNNEKQKQLSQIELRKEKEAELQRNTDPATSSMTAKAAGHQIVNKSNGKPDYVSYKFEMSLSGQRWCIIRRYSQFATLDAWFKKEFGSQWTGILPETSGGKARKFDQGFNDGRLQALANYLSCAIGSRSLLSRNKTAFSHFMRFILPIQIGDERPPEFMMPVKIELY